MKRVRLRTKQQSEGLTPLHEHGSVLECGDRSNGPHMRSRRVTTSHARSARADLPCHNLARPSARAVTPCHNVARLVRTCGHAASQRRTPCPHVRSRRVTTSHALSARADTPRHNVARPVRTCGHAASQRRTPGPHVRPRRVAALRRGCACAHRTCHAVTRAVRRCACRVLQCYNRGIRRVAA
jgi:hypothetical protein